jgi:hypothetical protein
LAEQKVELLAGLMVVAMVVSKAVKLVVEMVEMKVVKLVAGMVEKLVVV